MAGAWFGRQLRRLWDALPSPADSTLVRRLVGAAAAAPLPADLEAPAGGAAQSMDYVKLQAALRALDQRQAELTTKAHDYLRRARAAYAQRTGAGVKMCKQYMAFVELLGKRQEQLAGSRVTLDQQFEALQAVGLTAQTLAALQAGQRALQAQLQLQPSADAVAAMRDQMDEQLERAQELTAEMSEPLLAQAGTAAGGLNAVSDQELADYFGTLDAQDRRARDAPAQAAMDALVAQLPDLPAPAPAPAPHRPPPPRPPPAAAPAPASAYPQAILL